MFKLIIKIFIISLIKCITNKLYYTNKNIVRGSWKINGFSRILFCRYGIFFELLIY